MAPIGLYNSISLPYVAGLVALRDFKKKIPGFYKPPKVLFSDLIYTRSSMSSVDIQLLKPWLKRGKEYLFFYTIKTLVPTYMNISSSVLSTAQIFPFGLILITSL